jgi:hypothetical protein
LKLLELRDVIDALVGATTYGDRVRTDHWSDVEDVRLGRQLDGIFARLRGLRASRGRWPGIWLAVERESFLEARERYPDDDPSELQAFLEEECPDAVRWYRVDASDDDRERLVTLYPAGVTWIQRHGEAPVTLPGRGGADAIEAARELLSWMAVRIDREIARLRRDPVEYQEILERDLPRSERFGWFRRKDLWELAPPEWVLPIRDELGEAEREQFAAIAATLASSRGMTDLTLDDYLRFCAMCYDGAGYTESSVLSPLERYRRHADGRHEGLLDIDPRSPRALADWLEHRTGGGHPWEIARGGNSTHISLYLHRAGDGTHLILEGSSLARAAETMRMSLALHSAGVSFRLRDHELHRRRVLGEDAVAIVPNPYLGAGGVPSSFPEELAVHDSCSHEILAECPRLEPRVRWLDLERLELA